MKKGLANILGSIVLSVAFSSPDLHSQEIKSKLKADLNKDGKKEKIYCIDDMIRVNLSPSGEFVSSQKTRYFVMIEDGKTFRRSGPFYIESNGKLEIHIDVTKEIVDEFLFHDEYPEVVFSEKDNLSGKSKLIYMITYHEGKYRLFKFNFEEIKN